MNFCVDILAFTLTVTKQKKVCGILLSLEGHFWVFWAPFGSFSPSHEGLLLFSHGHCMHWGINPPSLKPPTPVSCQAPPLKSANCPSPLFLGSSPPFFIGFS